MFWRITNLLIAGDVQDGLLIIVCLPAKCSMKQHSGIQKALPGRPKERVWDNVHTRSRTWVVAATTRFGAPPADGDVQPLPCSLSGDVLSVGLVV